MSLNRYAKRRDANEGEIVEAARKLGWWLTPMDEPCDWLGCFRGSWYPIEIKGWKGRYTPSQEVFRDRCDVMQAPYLTWRSVDDMLADTRARQ